MPMNWLRSLHPKSLPALIFALTICTSLNVMAEDPPKRKRGKKAKASQIQLAAQQGEKKGLGVVTPDQFRLLDGFQVELVHEVQQGSWVSLTVDPKGRLIACDQYGGLVRVDVSGKTAEVESLGVEVQGAQGLLCAFDSLYINVNSRDFPSGVWRLRDTDGDDQYDTKEHLIELNSGGEHGPHALILTPDKKRILMCAGNNTVLPEDISRSRVPRNWDEDHLLGRMPDARGHNASRLAPGGFIASFNPDGSDIELVATGFRNEYDIALNQNGELFTYDADMEWDVGTPWYRPTRINHVVSGAEFGWRNGTGKWPAYYPDSFGSAVDIGPGSPTGICFGYGAKFPKKYQDALFICDWSYGNIHAVHLSEDGSTYSGEYETFATAAPLPVTDIVIHPGQGAMYFTIGGRRTQSGLYRVTYAGDATAPSAQASDEALELRRLRHQLEALHTDAAENAESLPMVLEHLGHEDRGIRFAARIALEHMPVDAWKSKVTALENDYARILGIVALARSGSAEEQSSAVNALLALDWKQLTTTQRVDLMRAYGLVALRLGEFDELQRGKITQQLASKLPSGNDIVDRELAQMLIYLQAPDAVEMVVQAMKDAPSQESQIHYAMVLRAATEGWTDDLQQDYFGWFKTLQSARGGMSFGGFIENIKKAALTNVSEESKAKLADVLAPSKGEDSSEPARAFVKKWTTDELLPIVSSATETPDFENGRRMFAAAACYKCHRMGVQGGILGPDLTGVGGRFSIKDLLNSMIDPSAVISDQYGATQFLTDEGRVVAGRVVNMSGNSLRVMTNMLDPSSLVSIDRETIEETREAKVSMMPEGLLDTLTAEEIIDLIAYLRAGGQEAHPIYKRSVASAKP